MDDLALLKTVHLFSTMDEQEIAGAPGMDAARHVAVPEMAAGAQLERGHPAAVADHRHGTPVDQRQAADVGERADCVGAQQAGQRVRQGLPGLDVMRPARRPDQHRRVRRSAAEPVRRGGAEATRILGGRVGLELAG